MKKLSFHKHRLVRQGLLYSLLLVLSILLFGGVGFWVLEPTVHSLGDGLWLSFTTAATVGYGDVVPTSNASRTFSVLVVVLGLAVLSLVTASLAAIFVEKEVEDEDRKTQAELLREVRGLQAEMRSLRSMLNAQAHAALSSEHDRPPLSTPHSIAPEVHPPGP